MNIKIAVDCFSTLGNIRRLEIIRLLIKANPNRLAMNEIAKKTSIPNSSLTHHIKLLEDAGLIIRHHEAQTIFCAIDIKAIKALSDFLLNECCSDSNKTC